MKYYSLLLISLILSYSSPICAQPGIKTWKSRIYFVICLAPSDIRSSFDSYIVKEIRKGTIPATYRDKNNDNIKKVSNKYLDSLFTRQLVLKKYGRDTVSENYGPDSMDRFMVKADLVYYLNDDRIEMDITTITAERVIVRQPVWLSDEGYLTKKEPLFEINFKDLSRQLVKSNPQMLKKFTGLIAHEFFKDDTVTLDGSYQHYVSSSYPFSLDISDHENHVIRQDTLLGELLINRINSGTNVWSIDDVLLTKNLTKQQINGIMSAVQDSFYLPAGTKRSDNADKSGFDYSSITSYKLLSKWSFNYESGHTTINLIAIAPRKDIRGEDYEYRGSRPMFWIRYADVKKLSHRIAQYNPQSSFENQLWYNIRTLQSMRILK